VDSTDRLLYNWSTLPSHTHGSAHAPLSPRKAEKCCCAQLRLRAALKRIPPTPEGVDEPRPDGDACHQPLRYRSNQVRVAGIGRGGRTRGPTACGWVFPLRFWGRNSGTFLCEFVGYLWEFILLCGVAVLDEAEGNAMGVTEGAVIAAWMAHWGFALLITRG
jgi:hypothetical protein